MSDIFDGKSFKDQKLQETKNKIEKNKLELQLVSFLVGEDNASKIYTNLKKQACESVGVKMNVLEYPEHVDIQVLKDKILELNQDKKINGIMIQLPLPLKLKQYTQDLINLISIEKDVDGMREDSQFTPATVRAVLAILAEAKALDKKIAVVGARGSVGKRIDCDKGFDVGDDLNELKNFDVIISATGHANLIKPEMIKENAVLIDVGAPKPEFDVACYQKARFYTPVPGGVGPVTIACLVENIVDSVANS